jgi:tRNA (guanine37-N1)-methyltransferase
MRFDIATLFPQMFTGPLTESILKRAQQARLITVALHDIRDYATDKHRTTDDYPYGGGAGMVMKPDPLAACIRAIKEQELGVEGNLVQPDEDMPASQGGEADAQRATRNAQRPVILLSPDGEVFTQQIAQELARYDGLILVCGHYEGVDERVRERLIDRELSIGDYVLTGGELAAMVVVDAVARLVPGVLDAASTVEESHGDHLLEYPHYTRPAEWEGLVVPAVLRSGHHGEVARWRRRQRLARTLARRPDLLQQAELSAEDRALLQELGWQG